MRLVSMRDLRNIHHIGALAVLTSAVILMQGPLAFADEQNNALPELPSAQEQVRDTQQRMQSDFENRQALEHAERQENVNDINRMAPLRGMEACGDMPNCN
ncbi:hypothetical protein [Roseibium sp. RKSG952]|uniref:hypothetical protein n=1 Tax=Roseibium sp. RKSG952 TaxID=2529384 RepID=UPI0012BBC1A4|nr:hypothetical protein [Roseibium sp. RKSG952]MTH99595.1 hypothetical protein [Roseibium sp. RKSG952]